MYKALIIAVAVVMCSMTVSRGTVIAQPTDRIALQGINSAKAVFDINLSDPERLPIYLQVIRETLYGLQKQGVKPEIVVAFRGPAVRLVSSNRKQYSQEMLESLASADKIISELAKQGTHFEACAIATRLFKVDNATILPEVTVVGNTFISLIGYQTKGYAVIPIQ
jgi:intracellular sulfur oxidation DsrE/DsrF family protein